MELEDNSCEGNLMSEKVLTVIVPVYNKESLVRKCLQSFVSDKLRNILEVIVIDDGSKDASFDIITEYAQSYPDIFVKVKKENGGVGSVMNLGLRMAKGKYVKEVDADDWVDTKALESLVMFLKECDADIILNPFWDTDLEGNCLKKYYFKGFYFGKEYQIEDVINRAPFSIQNVTVRKQMLEENHFLLKEDRYYIDMQFVGSSLLFASTCVLLSDSLYRYRKQQEEQSVSLSSYIKNRYNFYSQTVLSLDRLLEIEKNPELKNKNTYFKNIAKLYSLYLYAIFMLSREASEDIKRFDGFLHNNYREIYCALDKYECVRYARKWKFIPYGIRCYLFLRKWKQFSEKKGKEQELGDVGEIVAEKIVSTSNKTMEKFKEYYELLDQWMMNREQGISVENYCIKNGYKEIAIYGMGPMGNHLYEELSGSRKVQVSYAIDKRGTSIFPELSVKKPTEELPQVDAVIITVTAAYGSIVSMLEEKVKFPIISLEEVVCES